MEDEIRGINGGYININKFSFGEIREISNRIDWYWVSCHQDLSERFIREFSDKVDWNWVSCKKLSEGFIREFANRVNWVNICFDQKLSEEFIVEFYDRVNWKILCKYNKINKKIFKRMNREQKLYMLINHRDIWEKYNGR